MDDCVFCRIIQGEQAASIVYEDEQVIAFLDTRPVNPGHLLVVPRRHAASLAGLPLELGGRLFQAGMRLAAALRKTGLRCDGVNLYLADGRAAGQEVFHVHLHVVPRFSGDGFGLRFGPHYGERPPRAELDELAGRIRSALREGDTSTAR